MGVPLKVLLAEDNRVDAELILRTLRVAGFDPECQRVDSEADFTKALHPGLGLILSDYEMPQFSGMKALKIWRQSGIDVPFILISGTMGEDTAVAAMKLGAADYLLKDRLARLGQAVAHALEENRLRRERSTSDKALREANAYLHQLVSRSPTVIYAVEGADENSRIDFVSPNIAALTGFSVEETLHPSWWREHLDPDDMAIALGGWRLTATEGSGRVEYRIQQKDGKFIWVEDCTRLLSPLGSLPAHIVGGWTDITARKHAEDSAKESSGRFQQLAENIHEVFWMTDPEKLSFLYVSPAFEKIWGCAADRLYRDPAIWLQSIQADDRARISASLPQQAAGTFDETYRITRPDGALRWIHDRAFPVRNAAGEVYRLVGVAEDITERRELEAEAFRTQRLVSVGSLASGIAHDMNNILAPIMMSVSLLRSRMSAEPVERILATVEASAQRGADLVRQLLQFGRGVEGRRTSVDVSNILEELLKIQRQTFPRNIVVGLHYSKPLWAVVGDETQLHQVLLNLGVNARDAMPDGGSLTFAAENVTVSASEVSMSAQPGPFVRIQVTDTGMGIPPEVIDRIFDPFFTTKEIGKGTGLGLSTVMGIVKSHHGFLRLNSTVGIGTTFELFLPAQPQGSVPVAKAPTAPAPSGQGELILVVDDEPSLREIIRAVLVGHGYRVLVAAHGVEAVQLYAAQPNDVKAVITDMDMPEMDGRRLIKLLRQLNPDLPIILSTGVANHVGADQHSAEARALGINQVLIKPYSAQSVLQAVHQLFHR